MARREKAAEDRPRGEGAERGRFAGRMIFVVPLALALLVALVAGMYYTPLSIWYRESRQLRVLTEQKAAIDAYNEQLRASLESLETTEGIRVYAREQLDLVEEGDNTVIVIKDGQPLGNGADTQQLEILNIPYEYQPFGVWTPFLDRLFRIELPQQQQ